jgi:small subunit ribosomal protein S16
MPTRMRLQRHGKKGQPFYHLVIADGRAPRDGKFIERLGTYNPLTNPAEINIDFDLTLNWLKKGASPSETVRAILAYKGVLFKYHLHKGVLKGAMTEEQAEAKFQAWLTEKESKISQKKRNLEISGKDEVKKRLETEVKINNAKAEAVAKKLAKAAAKENETVAEESETPVAEVETTKTPVAEEEKVEIPVAKVEKVEEPIAEVEKIETPVVEVEKTETPAETTEPEETKE